MLNLLDKVARSLNILQSDSTDLCGAVKAWLALVNDEQIPVDLRKAVQERFNESMEVYHVIAYMVGKKSSDPDLDIEQYENAPEFLAGNTLRRFRSKQKP